MEEGAEVKASASSSSSSSAHREIRGPRVWSPLGLAPKMKKDALGLITELSHQYGPIVRFPLPMLTAFLINDPELIKKVLMETERSVVKGRMYARLNPVLGEGLVTSTGEKWKNQRRLSNPLFAPRMVEAFIPAMKEGLIQMMKRWELLAREKTTFDLSAEMMNLTFTLIVKTLFSTDCNQDTSSFSEHFHQFQEYGKHLFWSVSPLMHHLPTPKSLRFKRTQRELKRIIYGWVDDRLARAREGKVPAGSKDLLTLMMEAYSDRQGDPSYYQLIFDEVLTLMLAGHDTTANTLSFCFYLLSGHPQNREKLEQECVPWTEGRWPTFEELSSLPYTKMVVEETLRLYPAAWMINRELKEDWNYEGYFFPKGSTFFLSPYVMHRHPQYWADPESFRPERFAAGAEDKEGRPKFSYFPFGGGPRVCIGASLAMSELLYIVSSITRQFRVQVEAPVGGVMQLDPLITLGPLHAIKAKVEKRTF